MMSGTHPKMYGYEDNLINEIELIKVEMKRDQAMVHQRQEAVDHQFLTENKRYRLTRRWTILNFVLIALVIIAMGVYWIVIRQTDSESKTQSATDYQASRISVMDMRVRGIAMDIETQAKLSVAMKMRLREMQADIESQEKRLIAVEKRVQLVETNTSLHGQQLNNVDGRMREMAGNIEQQNWGVFLWRIDRWASRRDTALKRIGIVSDAFFSDKNGYKMRLSLRPADQPKWQQPICVYWHLMRGPFDSILAWPFRRSVTLSLVNQHMRANSTSSTLKLDQRGSTVTWSRPTGDADTGICFNFTLSFDELSDNRDLCVNDQVFIRCVLGSISSGAIVKFGLSFLLVLASVVIAFILLT